MKYLRKKYKTIETFVGAGGSFLGFKKAGFEASYVNDIDNDFLKTLVFNNSELNNITVDNTSIVKVNFSNLRSKLKIKKKEIDVIFGGPVCKGYSLAGVRDPSDIRNTLYQYQIKLIDEFRPKIALIENVPAMRCSLILKNNTKKSIVDEISYIYKKLDIFKGIKAKLRKENTTLSSGEEKEYSLIKQKKRDYESIIKDNSISVIDDIRERLEAIGYRVKIANLNASWFGSYTKRIRTIVAAVRDDIEYDFEYPEITHHNDDTKKHEDFKYSKNLKRLNTIKDAFSLLDSNKNNPQKDEDNKAMNHNEKSVRRFALIPKGKNFIEVMNDAPKDLHISKFYSRGCTMRLDDNKPAPTLVPGHSNFPIHPTEHRSITVREAAIISGFPANYKFFGNHTKRCEQVGNAVPIHLSHALAKSCRRLLDKIDE
jgi:DNA (cytosine-5)-methyltransferase 1